MKACMHGLDEAVAHRRETVDVASATLIHRLRLFRNCCSGCAIFRPSRMRLFGSVGMIPPKRIIVFTAVALAFVAGAALTMALRAPPAAAIASIQIVNGTVH
jgi:hypothetical protein